MSKSRCIIDEIFILNTRGDLISAKSYADKQSPNEDMYEESFKYMSDLSQSPWFSMGLRGKDIIFLRRKELFLAIAQSSVTRSTRSESVDMLVAIEAVLNGFLQSFDEKSVYENSQLVAEIFDEVVFRGRAVCLSVQKLREDLILSELKQSSKNVTKYDSLRILSVVESLQLLSYYHISDPLPNEIIIITVSDSIRALIDSKGKYSQFILNGVISLKSLNIIDHELHIAVKNTAVIRERLQEDIAGDITENAIFNKLVNIPYFDKHRILRFDCKEDSIQLMHYAGFEPTPLPLIVTCTTKKRLYCSDMIDIFVVIQTNFNDTLSATGTKIKIKFGKSVSCATCECFGAPLVRRNVSFCDIENEIKHSVEDIIAGNDLHFHYVVRSTTPVCLDEKVGTFSLEFSVSGYCSSSIRVTSIKKFPNHQRQAMHNSPVALKEVLYITEVKILIDLI